jgi:hypothetical protein
MSGSLIEVSPPEDNPFEDAGFFRLDITEASITYLGGDPPDHLVIESWNPKVGWQRRTRT